LTPEKKQKLDDIAEELFEYIDEVKVIKDIFDALPIKVPIASPYLNFRDALFHYNKMYSAARDKNEYGFIEQGACIEEHLNRGLKDFVIYLCSNFYVRIIHIMMDSKSKSLNIDIHCSLRCIYHRFKNLVIEIRLEGETLKHFDNHQNVWLPTFVDIVEDFNNLLKNHNYLMTLYNRYGANFHEIFKPISPIHTKKTE
jgi:hypothetical protein